MTYAKWLTLIVATALLWNCSDQPERRQSDSSEGAPPRLRGFQIASFSSGHPAKREFIGRLPELKRWGANSARLFVSPNDVYDPAVLEKPLTETLSASFESHLEEIDLLLDAGLWVIVAVWLEGVWPSEMSLFWTEPALQQQLVEAWGHLARVARGRPRIIFDLLNEPHGRFDAVDRMQVVESWNRLYPQLVAAIRKEDPKRWVMVEPYWGDAAYFPYLNLVQDERILYSFHSYSPHSFTHQPEGESPVPYPGTYRGNPHPGIYLEDPSYWNAARLWNKEELARSLKAADEFQKRVGPAVRIHVGELGGVVYAKPEDRARWMRDLLELLDGRGWDWTCFEYDGGTKKSVKWYLEGTPCEPVLREFLGH